MFATISAVQAAPRNAALSVDKLPPAEQSPGKTEDSKDAKSEQLHYVHEIGAYNKDNWVASWNALAVVVSWLHLHVLPGCRCSAEADLPACAALHKPRLNGVR
jgi:hypothetical protein